MPVASRDPLWLATHSLEQGLKFYTFIKPDTRHPSESSLLSGTFVASRTTTPPSFQRKLESSKNAVRSTPNWLFLRAPHTDPLDPSFRWDDEMEGCGTSWMGSGQQCTFTGVTKPNA